MKEQKQNYIRYEIDKGKNLFFLPHFNRFSFDCLPSNIEAQYYEDELSEMRIEITYLCNGNCKYCIVFGNSINGYETLELREIWNWFTSQFWFKKIKRIFIIGGEPFLRSSDLFFLLKNFEGEVRISTNATLITKEIANKLAKYNVLLYVSLDGPRACDNSMRVYKNGQHMFPDVIRGLKFLGEAQVPYGIFMVATKDNIYRAVDVIKERDTVFNPVRIGYSMPHWTDTNYDEISAEDYRDALIDLFYCRREINAQIMQINWRIKPLWKGKIKRFSCALHTSQVTVLPDQSLVRCSKIDHDSILKKVSNEDLNNGCPLAMASKGTEPCASCLAVGCCGGGCPFDGLKRYGGIIDKRECIITPAIVELALKEVIAKIKTDDNLKRGLIDPKYIKEVLL